MQEEVVLRVWEGKQKQAIGWYRGREGCMETGRGGGSRITPWMCVKLPGQLDHTRKNKHQEGEECTASDVARTERSRKISAASCEMFHRFVSVV